MVHLSDDLRGVAWRCGGGQACMCRFESIVSPSETCGEPCAQQETGTRHDRALAGADEAGMHASAMQDLKVVPGDVDSAVYFSHVCLPAAALSPQQHQTGTIAGRHERKRASLPRTPRT